MVLEGFSRRRRRTIRAREGLLGTDAVETAMPGRLLVLLSRLHRSEGTRSATIAGEDDAVPCA